VCRSPHAHCAGIPVPSLPTSAITAVLSGALGDVFTLAVVAYAISISVARTYAAKVGRVAPYLGPLLTGPESSAHQREPGALRAWRLQPCA
jgi:hypothetical protein